ncbi:MAG: 50S ribosomal protein L3 [Candidatus Paceibacterota bacterium]
MKFLLGEKQNMSQLFREDGNVVPVTAVKAYPSTVVFVRTVERDGYKALQLGAGNRKENKTPKPEKGHFGEYGPFRVLQEFKLSEEKGHEALEKGTVLDITQFTAGDKLTVSAISKGKGFQGVVKRHNFAGGPRTHGQKHSEREPGSIGATGPQRVLKGTKMAGRMGGRRTTLKNAEVVEVLPEKGIIFIKGAIPGRPGTVVSIKGIK